MDHAERFISSFLSPSIQSTVYI